MLRVADGALLGAIGVFGAGTEDDIAIARVGVLFNHSAFNIGNAFGASRGSVLLGQPFGYGALGIGGALRPIGGLLVYLLALFLFKKSGMTEECQPMTNEVTGNP